MKKTTQIKYEDAIANAEAYIEQLKTMDDRKLAKHLDLFRQQMEIAYKTNNHAAFELLCEYERQVIEARANKE
jgi:hypothetical protein